MRKFIECLEKNIIWVLGIVLLIIYILIGSKKEGFHVDEYISFLNANTSSGERQEMRESGRNTYSGKELLDFCLIRDKYEAFDYEEVWDSQAEDTHPPLFYAIVHTVCSLVYTRVGLIAIGVGINIAIALLTYFVLVKLTGLFVENKTIAAIYAFLYSTSFAMVNCLLFVRMYMLLVFFSVLYVYVLCKNILQKNYSVKFYLQLAAVVCGGALTHYYFMIFLAFSCLILLIYFICKKDYKTLLMGIVSVAGALALSCLIYPEGIKQILGGDRGTQAFENFGSSDFISRLKTMSDIVNQQVFGGCMAYVYGIICIVLLAVIIKICKERKYKCEFNIAYVMLIAPAFLTFVIISKVAAYLTDRYVMALMFALFLGTFLLMQKLLEYLVGNRFSNWIVIILMSLCVLKAYENPIPYLAEGNKENKQIIEQYASDAKYIYLYDEDWKILPNLFQMEELEEITFYHNIDDLYNCADFEQYDTLILYNSMNISDEEAEQIAQATCEKGEYTECSHLFSSGYSETYVLIKN